MGNVEIEFVVIVLRVTYLLSLGRVRRTA